MSNAPDTSPAPDDRNRVIELPQRPRRSWYPHMASSETARRTRIDIAPSTNTRRRRFGANSRFDRSLIHWTIAYLAGAWLLLQLMDVLGEIWHLPIDVQRFVCLALGLGIPPALVIAWYHGEKGRQGVCAVEVVLVGLLLAGSGAVLWTVFS